MGRDRAITSAFGCDWAISVRGETVSMRFRYLGPVRAPSRPENGSHPGNGVTDCSGDATKGRNLLRTGRDRSSPWLAARWTGAMQAILKLP